MKWSDAKEILLRDEIGKILEGVYEQGVIDEHGEIKSGETLYPELALQPSKALDSLCELILTKQKESELNVWLRVKSSVENTNDNTKQLLRFHLPDYDKKIEELSNTKQLGEE